MRCTEMLEAAAAATTVASARAAPARGAAVSDGSIRSVAARQVMHTMTVDRPAGPTSLIRMAPGARARGAERVRFGCCQFPHSRDNSTVAEAPRPARDQMDGRSPGSRVSATCRLPDLSLADRNQWHRASARRLQLRGQPWVCFERLAALDAYHIPSSLSRLREAIKGGSTTLCPRVVNGDPTTAGPWSLTAA